MKLKSNIKSGDWLAERVPAGELVERLRGWKLESHSRSYWAFLGGTSLFFFCVQLISGMLLLLYYSPTPDTAHESVETIISRVEFGWLVRSIHAWSANMLVGSVFLHLFSMMLLRAYRKPRELVWITGLLSMFVILGFAFTGYLLPWDVVSFAATNIGTEVPKSIPIIGGLISTIMRGGDAIGPETLKRLFALHVSIFPVVSLGLIGIHIMLRFMHGLSVPIGVRSRPTNDRIYPEYLLKNVIVWSACAVVLVSMSVLLPPVLGPKADMLGAAPAGIKPEWYFWFLFESMKLAPVTVFGLDGEMLVNLGMGIGALLLLGLPFIDRKAAREEKDLIVTGAGIAMILYMVTMTTLAYFG